MRYGAGLACLMAAGAGLVLAQDGAVHLEFEAASIKPASKTPADERTLLQPLPGGGLRVSNATLHFLIALAYQVSTFQVVGGGGWIDSERFDIAATAEHSAAPEIDLKHPTEAQYKTMQEQMRPRLRTLLADRFQLRFHREMREEQVYSLGVGRGGSKLRAEANFGGLRAGKNQLTGNGATLAMLASALAGNLGRPVLDRTGLEGTYAFQLEWATDGAAAAGADGPSLFTAVQEQLGLRLESTRAPVEVLVIDRASRPSEN